MITRAAVITGLGVALGAFGAHALRPTLEAAGRLDEWHTAVLYQMIHGVALLAIGVWGRLDGTARQSRGVRATGLLWVLGVVAFSGSLYALGLGVPSRWIWPVTPLGGLCFLAGWTVLAIASARRARSAPRGTP